MRRLALIVAALAALSPALAAELIPLRHDQRIGVRIQNLDFPDTLRKELMSGLTNRLLVRVSLERDSRVLEETAVEVAVRYDLWDEVFHFMVISSRGRTSRTLGALDATIRELVDLRLPDLFEDVAIDANAPLLIRADVLLNPIDRERMDRIRQWVAENTTTAPGDSSYPTRTTSAASEVFARIFEQYAAGKDVASVWRRTITSRPFRVNELSNDAR